MEHQTHQCTDSGRDIVGAWQGLADCVSNICIMGGQAADVQTRAPEGQCAHTVT